MSFVATLRELRTRTLLVPEVLQSSMMDCGPATLKSVFDGFRRPINYERLRERCQTDVDGTSLPALAETADRLGLDVDQVMVPKDSLLLDEAACLPAIIMLSNPEGLLHFVTLWSKLRGLVQVMDPARGRVWMREETLLRHVATPQIALPEARWREWASGADFTVPLAAKLRLAGVPRREAERLIAAASEDPSTRSLASLDAAARFARGLVSAGAIPSGAASRQLVHQAFEGARTGRAMIPDPYWICVPGPKPGQVLSTGALLMTVYGTRDIDPADLDGTDIEQAVARARRTALLGQAHPRRLSTVGFFPGAAATIGARVTSLGVASANVARMSLWAGPVVPKAVIDELRAPTVRPHRVFAHMLWADSPVAVVLLGALVVVGIATGVLDAILMRGLSELLGGMNLVKHRLVAIGAVVGFLVLAMIFDLAQAHLVQRLARGLETRFRVAFLEKLPKLEDRYFRSRPTSDMASRAHLLQTLRGIPRFLVSAVSGVLNVAVTSAVIVWFEPRLWKLAALVVTLCLFIPFLSYRLIDDALAKMRVLGASLYRFYLDALLGVVAVRAHGAERSVRREHEGILTEWVRSALEVERRAVALAAGERLIGTLIAVSIVVMYVHVGGDIRALLLIAFFAQRLPGQAEALVNVLRTYPLMKHDALRLFEPLAAAEETTAPAPTAATPGKRRGPEGVEIIFNRVTAVAGGRPVLTGVDVTIGNGQHVAVVGPSGAGKSSFVGAILGWLFVAEGRILIDRRPLDAQRRLQLREETAWVDPAVQLWNKTLLENILYGHGDEGLAELEGTLDAADLFDVVERAPNGLQSPLGEGGARISGGQGQRVRVGRALLSASPRLVILDEPFRGLEREKRRELLRRARERWAGATLLFVTHDVGDTADLDRVLVVEGGELVEDGAPADLLARDSSYRRLFDADREALEAVWGREEWRRFRLEDGRLVERDASTEAETETETETETVEVEA